MTASPQASKRVGLIPAAGKGMRARPYTHEIHKGLFDINGAPNMERIISIMRDDMGISDIFIVVGYLGDSIREYFGDGSRFSVNITYIENENLDKGWAWSIYLARSHIDSECVVMLCDECYLHSNHAALAAVDLKDNLALCAGLMVDDDQLIRKNYTIEREGDRVLRLVEKPQRIINDIMGSGTFLLSPNIFDVLDNAFKDSNRVVDFVELLNQQIEAGAKVAFFELQGTYVNINDRDSLHLAKYHDRQNNFITYNASLLIFSEGDEEQIAFTINRYNELEIFSQIAVVMPHQNTVEQQVRDCGVEVIVCPEGVQQFGERIHYGLDQLNGDILVMTEADYSFPARDVEKLFTYLKEADMVVGTRTTRQLIEQGSTMQGIVRAAHTALGNFLGFLWWQREGRFTDVGCMLRGIWKTTYQQISPQLQSSGPEFLAEMAIVSLDNRLRVLEIPVNYFNRGIKQNRNYRNAATFFRLLGFIVRRRFTGQKKLISDKES